MTIPLSQQLACARLPKSEQTKLTSIRDVKSGDRILRADGKLAAVQGIYPAAGTHFVQFDDGMGWHCPDDGKVFVEV